MKKIIVALFVAAIAALTLTVTTGTAAHAERVGSCHKTHRFANGTVRMECRHKVQHPRRIKSTYWFAETPNRLQVTFTDGAKFDFAPCKWEDSRTCYWNAHKRGNGVGRSFVNLYGKVYYLHRYVADETVEQGALPFHAPDAQPFNG